MEFEVGEIQGDHIHDGYVLHAKTLYSLVRGASRTHKVEARNLCQTVALSDAKNLCLTTLFLEL